MMFNKITLSLICVKLTNFLLCLSKVATNVINVFQEKKKGFTGQGKIHLIRDVITHVPEVCRDMSDVGRKPPKC